ncbi:hypothetical protein B0H12DRAFT_1219175 [Mycena haematopus]|nr:hypothetical protein B0H12DRAFT_1219175 [Mycena haematopus]
MADVVVGVDVTSQQAEEISRRILDGVAAIRDAYCHHNDLRLANVVFRNWPHDPQPVVIDFGLNITVPGSPREASFGTVNEVMDMRKTLSNGYYGDWHVRSPLQQHVYERHAQFVGYATINSEIEKIPDDVRSVQFERIPSSGGPEERDKRLQWRVRPGIRTQDDYEHEWLLAFPPDPDEYNPPIQPCPTIRELFTSRRPIDSAGIVYLDNQERAGGQQGMYISLRHMGIRLRIDVPGNGTELDGANEQSMMFNQTSGIRHVEPWESKIAIAGSSHVLSWRRRGGRVNEAMRAYTLYCISDPTCNVVK